MAGQIFEIKEEYYPFAEAVQKSIAQNVRRDHAMGLIDVNSAEELDADQRQIYTLDAIAVLARQGKNHLPHYPDTARICVQKPEVENV